MIKMKKPKKITDKRLDALYAQKKKLEIEQLELEKEEITLKLQLQELTKKVNGGNEIQQIYGKDYGLYPS